MHPDKCQARIWNKLKKCKSLTCTKHQVPAGLGLQCNARPFGSGGGKSLYCRMHDNQHQLTQGPMFQKLLRMIQPNATTIILRL